MTCAGQIARDVRRPGIMGCSGRLVGEAVPALAADALQDARFFAAVGAAEVAQVAMVDRSPVSTPE
ncbi:MAG: hypothetical protein LC749_03270 [Actinobacteria bacterium]|nr:hypothetical protein [Actinomycetota bacterium]